jgi:hypothetical protein
MVLVLRVVRARKNFLARRGDGDGYAPSPFHQAFARTFISTLTTLTTLTVKNLEEKLP